MIELEEGFSANDRFLVEEHLKNGTDDFLLTDVGNKTFVVPYKYRKAAKDEIEAITKFKMALLDFQQAEADKYSEAGLIARTETYEGVDYVVPFRAREQDVSPQKLAAYVAQKAALKYDAIIEAYQKLEKRGVRLGAADFSAAALAKYTHHLVKIEKQEEQGAERVRKFCDKAKGKFGRKSQTSAEQIAKQAKALVKNAGDFAGRHSRAVGVTAAVGLGLVGAQYIPQSCTEHKQEKVAVPAARVQQKGTYVDFRGVKHSDRYGNIAKIMEMKSEISALLVSVEGFADKAYDDNTGVMTIGSGLTFYLDELGNHHKVQKWDKITPEEAMIHKWRFIEAEMLDLLGDTIGRSCSKEELAACIGAGFCWGKNGLSGSEFYKSVCKGESVEIQGRKLTGFRTPIGLLKREYLLKAFLTKKWTGKDLLDMPVYKYKGNYVGCGIYRVDFADIMPCRRNKKGDLIKRAGRHVPVVDSDDYCTYYNNFDEIKRQICDEARFTIGGVKEVRELLPKEMVEEINMMANTETFNLMLQKNANLTR